MELAECHACMALVRAEEGAMEWHTNWHWQMYDGLDREYLSLVHGLNHNFGKYTLLGKPNGPQA